MKTRNVVIFTGKRFAVPQCIQRIDTKATHGWQVRYHGTKLFSDHSADGSGAAAALTKATKELLARIAAHPAPVTLQRARGSNKSSELPPGISGPSVIQRAGRRSREARLLVLLPRFGQAPEHKTIHIGTEKTYTPARYQQALARAVELRGEYEQRYAAAATRARRKAAAQLKATLRARAA